MYFAWLFYKPSTWRKSKNIKIKREKILSITENPLLQDRNDIAVYNHPSLCYDIMGLICSQPWNQKRLPIQKNIKETLKYNIVNSQ